jgi:hypothetical protein
MMLNRKIAALFLLAASLVAHPSVDRAAAAGDRTLRPKTIAVISGLNKETNLLAVDLITQALAKNSRLKVLSSERVAAGLHDYPLDIRGPYRAEYFNIVEDPANTDRAAVKRIKKQLGVDYLYVVWMLGGTSDNFGQASVNFTTQLFAGPESTLAHNSGFGSTAQGGLNCCLNFKQPTGEQQSRELAKSCEQHAREVEEEIEKK